MHDPPLDNYYRLLELRAEATPAEIREAYRVLSRVWHPDRFAGSPDMQARATARQQELNTAYQQLLRAHRVRTSAADAGGRSRQRRSHEYDAPTPPHPGDAPAAGAAARAGTATGPGAAAGPGAATGTGTATGPGAATNAGSASSGGAARSGAAGWFPWRRLNGRRAVMAWVAAVLAGGAVLIAAGFVARDGVVRDTGGAVVRGLAIAAGGAQACAAADSRVWCWGTSFSGLAAGVAEPDWRARAAAVPLPDSVVAVASGLLHSCALLGNGSIYCWGSNILGQLGIRGLQDRDEPARVAFGGAFVSVSTLGRHTCGVTADGALYCWGDDVDGQLGVGRPLASCRLDGLRFFCSDRPEQVGSAGQWRGVSAGGGHTCGLAADGSVYCWGSNRFGQLGAGANDSCPGPGGAAPCSRSPVRVALDASIVAVATGASHTCALDAEGRAWCWGLNAQWQTGTDAGRTVPAPAVVDTALRFGSLIAGAYHTCGITPAGALHCWGSDAQSELRGRGPDRCDGVPCAARAVRLATGVDAVAAGFGITCSRRRDGVVRCWGDGGADRNPQRTAGSPTNLRVRAAGARLRLDALRNVVYRTVVQPIEQAL